MIYEYIGIIIFCLTCLIIAGMLSHSIIKKITFNAFISDRIYELDKSKAKHDFASKKLSYTKDVIAFIREFSIDNTALAFDQFIASSKIEKINRAILVKFITQVASETKEALQSVNIDYDLMMVTDNYIDKMIIDCTMHSGKQLFETTYGETIEIENIV